MKEKKTISRVRTRLSILLFAVFILLVILGAVTREGMPILISLAALAAGVVLMLVTNRCPCCGAFFRGLSWGRPDAGHCRSCGELMIYDDSAASRKGR